MATTTPTFKVILCGEYGVGKSSIFRRFTDNSFTVETGPKSTVGLDHAVNEFNASGTNIRVGVMWKMCSSFMSSMSVSWHEITAVANATMF